MKKIFPIIIAVFLLIGLSAPSVFAQPTDGEPGTTTENTTKENSTSSQSSGNTTQLEVEYPTVPTPEGDVTVTSSTSLPDYILFIFWFALGALGIVAFSAFIYAGVLWLTAAGNTGQVQKAKNIFINVLLGVILILGAFLLFQLLNPEILFLSGPDMPSVAITNAPICVPTVKEVQEACQQRGPAWVSCNNSQKQEADCDTADKNGDGIQDQVCCRRLPSGELGSLCPANISSTQINDLNSCSRYAGLETLFEEQNTNPSQEDIKQWCNKDTCSVTSSDTACYWLSSQCEELQSSEINSCSDYMISGAIPEVPVESTRKELCNRDPFNLGCRYKKPVEGQATCEPTGE